MLFLDLLESMMTSLGGGQWQCSVCSYTSKSTNLKYHIEAKHMTKEARYQCPHCDKLMSTRAAYNIHLSSYHRQLKHQ